MSARQAMRQRADIERDASGSDDWGGQGSPDWQPHLAGVPCHFWTAQGRAVVNGQETAVIEDLRLLLPLGTDIASTDRIGRITDRLGVPIVDGPLLVEAVVQRADHLVALVKEVG